MFDYKNKIFKLVLLACLVGLVLASVFVLKPSIDPNGDGPSYLKAMEVLKSGAPPDFVPNRILTTALGLWVITFISSIVGSVVSGWFVWNLSLYFLLAVAFYNLVARLFEDEKVALLSTLFLASNYAMANFGLGFFMDIGGWAFYIFSIYFLFLYSETKSRKMLLLSALMVGVGGLFKEYAFLGAIPIFCYLVYEHFPSPKKIIRSGLLPAAIVLVPTFVLHFYVYQKFGYTYLDWLSSNQDYYVYASRISEYIKSLGSLVNLLALPFIFGLYHFIKNGVEIMPEKKNKVFVLSLFVSILPIFFWPAITQRILFIIVPFLITLSAFAFKRYQKHWYVFLILLIPYILLSFTMNSFILPLINLPF